MMCEKLRKKMISGYGNNHDEFVSLLKQEKKHYLGIGRGKTTAQRFSSIHTKIEYVKFVFIGE